MNRKPPDKAPPPKPPFRLATAPKTTSQSKVVFAKYLVSYFRYFLEYDRYLVFRILDRPCGQYLRPAKVEVDFVRVHRRRGRQPMSASVVAALQAFFLGRIASGEWGTPV